MAGSDEAKGRAKRAVGELTGDDELKQEGQVVEFVGGGPPPGLVARTTFATGPSCSRHWTALGG